MSNIDSLLTIMRENGADELRLGTAEKPLLFAGGVPRRLTIAATDDQTLRFLLAGILTPEAEAALRDGRELEVDYDAASLGAYRVKFCSLPNGQGLRAVVLSGSHPATPPPLTSPPVTPPLPRPTMARAREPSRVQASVPERVDVAARHDSAPGPALLALIEEAVRRRASDIHLAQGDRPRIRIDGTLYGLGDGDALDLQELLELGAEARLALSQGAAVEYTVTDPNGGSVRVHVYATMDGVAAALRLLPPHAPALASLNLPVPLDDLIGLPHGLVLVCGASGSGKSTTLAALAQAALASRSIVLVTLEDPVEYVLEAGPRSLVRRRQVGRDVPSFATGLRDALRENPDLLLVGELRDAEAIQMAVTAAETGHLVLATLHTRSAPSAITRLVDAYPSAQQELARRQIAESLRAVVAQRLLPRARPPGRVPALEVLRVNQAAMALIREGKTPQLITVMQAARNEGMLWLERCLADLVRDGTITIDVARAAANDPASLALQLGPRS